MLPAEVKRMIEAIERKRDKEVDGIISQAREDSKKILDTGKDEGKRIMESIYGNYRLQAEGMRNRQIAEAELKNRIRIRRMKSEVTESVKRKAVERALKEGYGDLFSVLFRNALSEIGGGDLQAFVRPEDVPLAKEAAEKNGVNIEVKEIETLGGVMLRSGRMTSNHLIEFLVERRGNEIDSELNKILFSG
jgi:vacuolar-type H+-ATPase subunit E/Vma4